MTTQESPADSARDLVRRTPTAALAVTLGDGSPYASLVLAATDHGGQPLLFISRLAEHTRALEADPRASLLFDGTVGLADRLTGARVSLVGRLARDDDPWLKERFFRRHPAAEIYRDFADFSLWRMVVERAHLVAGFGRIHWIDGGAFVLNAAQYAALQEGEAGVVAHMNEDHLDAIALYATQLLGEADADWRISGVDPEGIDLIAGDRRSRLRFPSHVSSVMEVRTRLVELVKTARELHKL
ncbi:HugZ family pyridoxamine 5'-phosphate oxidase [Oleomonas cavernae]|uniref:HugZ family pyridoxamine 5'-phosphate oxidase n=1 Tax=Oleomonas cavernae TaxID=2320859 RepID=UPI001F2BB4BE|nr:DUF2470 domain-containing protein [Oleomonas cavernae]